MLHKLPDFTTDTLATHPIERAHTIPASWYTHDAVFEFERKAIFDASWQYVGHVSQVAHAGDVLIGEVTHNPVLITRGQDNILRAFHNVCRHRAGPLATENACGLRVLQCKYHGWTYTLDGMLRGVPHWDRVDLFDKKDFGLQPVRLAEWEGLLFVNLAHAEGAPPLESQFAGIRERIAPVNLSSLKHHRRVVYPIDCNWKVYVDNYLEGYHVPIVHPELNKVLDYSRYTSELHPHYSLQYSPFRADADNSMYGADTTEAFYYFVFPNMMLNIIGDRLQVNHVAPVDAGHCNVIFDYLYRDTASDQALKQIAADIAYSEAVQREDEEICVQVQRGLRSSSYKTGRFSVEREEGVHHFQSLLRRAFCNARANPDCKTAELENP